MNGTQRQAQVLIVDDMPINIQVLAEALHADYRVRVAPSAKVALEVIAKQGVPDLILLDVMMPEMDGYQLCRLLKDDPATKQVPIIFVTAKAEVMDEAYGLRLGAADYITKPFHLPIVVARVRNQINLKQKADLLESLVMLDGLTNIPNRRRFDEALDREWRRARRNGAPLGLIMMDVDFFKAYNDHYGHGAGDDCLRQIAAALAGASQRPGDLVARYGGEEFVALLPDTDAEGACYIAECFREAVARLAIPHEYSEVAPYVTLSLGCASTIAEAANEPLALLGVADRRFYQAKALGRNRVCGV